jgi:hypothetical protein
MISVACDICGQNYDLSDQLYGKLHKCRECDTRFEVSDDNAPVEPAVEGEEPPESDFAGVWRIMRGTAAGIAILAACGWMTALLFYDPWQRPPLEFKAQGNVDQRRPVAAVPRVNNPPAIPRPAANPPAFPATPPANPQFAPGAAPQTAQTTPPATTPPPPTTAQSLLEQQRAEVERIRREAQERVQKVQRRPPALPGSTAPGTPPPMPNQPPSSTPGPIRPRFGPGATPTPSPRPSGNRPGPPARP